MAHTKCRANLPEEERLGLYDKTGVLCANRTYSTGKSQLHAIDEILHAFQTNNIVVFKGMVGSGKSIIGVRVALDPEYGHGIVAVPTIVLSQQYTDDYDGNNKYFSFNGHRASICILKGRGNFFCPRRSHAIARGSDVAIRADERYLPCTRDIDHDIGDTRLKALQDCANWGFIFPSLRDDLAPFNPRSYHGLRGDCFLCGVHAPCEYWNQFDAYLSADCIVMNKDKWRSEVAIGRLPVTPITVIDEADQFLDSLIQTITISDWHIKRLALPLLELDRPDLRKARLEQEKVRSQLEKNWKAVLLGITNPIEFIEDSLLPLLELSEDPALQTLRYNIDEFVRYKSLLAWEIQERSIKFAIPYPDKLLANLQERIGGKLLLMSATFQERSVLQSIYKINPSVITGETRFPGCLIEITTGKERSMSNKDWKEDEERSLSWFESFREAAFGVMSQPALEPLHSKRYFRGKKWDELIENQNEKMEAFRLRPRGILSTTKMDRGVDLKGVKAIFIDKYPNPGLDDLGLKTIKKRLTAEQGEDAFWHYYGDIARRDFIQQIGRTLRHPTDIVEFWSPDIQCHQNLPQVWKGEIIREMREISSGMRAIFDDELDGQDETDMNEDEDFEDEIITQS